MKTIKFNELFLTESIIKNMTNKSK